MNSNLFTCEDGKDQDKENNYTILFCKMSTNHVQLSIAIINQQTVAGPIHAYESFVQFLKMAISFLI